MKLAALLLATSLSFVSSPAFAEDCQFPRQGDYLARLLARLPSCPTNALELRAAIEADGLELRAAMVANRGFHNPSLGSFSLFERALGTSRATGMQVEDGEFHFGHFTAAAGTELILDQAPSNGALMVELIAWDPAKRLFNFYELIGQGTQGQWFYRGDSADIAADLKLLHRQPDPARPVFGNRLRCSGCHLNGGPILKEMTAPHNDWWSETRGLDFGGRTPDPQLARVMQKLKPTSELAQAVQSGMNKLRATKLPGITLQEKLRPLFCPMEMQLDSDTGQSAGEISVPSEYYVDPRLAWAELTLSRTAYENAIARAGFRFPETQLRDAAHAWLAPVKAESDQKAVDVLVADGLIDEEFVLDALAVGFGNPALSPERCGLLKLVPETESAGWRAELVFNLSVAPALSPARDFWENLTDPHQNSAAHRALAAALLESKREQLALGVDIGTELQILQSRRTAIGTNEISKNPRGRILEPGFRVIFPVN